MCVIEFLRKNRNMGINLDKFKIDNNDLPEFLNQFSLVAESVNLEISSRSEVESKIIESLMIDDCNVTGVYFWILRIEDAQYKIYAGKTKSLKRRLSDYFNKFQIHSPNDYKLKFFQSFIFSHLPNADFDLYFKQCNLSDYTEYETQTVNQFKPLINERAQVTDEAKDKMKQAFAEYYESVCIAKISM